MSDNFIKSRNVNKIYLVLTAIGLAMAANVLPFWLKDAYAVACFLPNSAKCGGDIELEEIDDRGCVDVPRPHQKCVACDNGYSKCEGCEKGYVSNENGDCKPCADGEISYNNQCMDDPCDAYSLSESVKDSWLRTRGNSGGECAQCKCEDGSEDCARAQSDNAGKWICYDSEQSYCNQHGYTLTESQKDEQLTKGFTCTDRCFYMGNYVDWYKPCKCSGVNQYTEDGYCKTDSCVGSLVGPNQNCKVCDTCRNHLNQELYRENSCQVRQPPADGWYYNSYTGECLQMSCEQYNNNYTNVKMPGKYYERVDTPVGVCYVETNEPEPNPEPEPEPNLDTCTDGTTEPSKYDTTCFNCTFSCNDANNVSHYNCEERGDALSNGYAAKSDGTCGKAKCSDIDSRYTDSVSSPAYEGKCYDTLDGFSSGLVCYTNPHDCGPADCTGPTVEELQVDYNCYSCSACNDADGVSHFSCVPKADALYNGYEAVSDGTCKEAKCKNINSSFYDKNSDKYVMYSNMNYCFDEHSFASGLTCYSNAHECNDTCTAGTTKPDDYDEICFSCTYLCTDVNGSSHYGCSEKNDALSNGYAAKSDGTCGKAKCSDIDSRYTDSVSSPAYEGKCYDTLDGFSSGLVCYTNPHDCGPADCTGPTAEELQVDVNCHTCNSCLDVDGVSHFSCVPKADALSSDGYVPQNDGTCKKAKCSDINASYYEENDSYVTTMKNNGHCFKEHSYKSGLKCWEKRNCTCSDKGLSGTPIDAEDLPFDINTENECYKSLVRLADSGKYCYNLKSADELDCNTMGVVSCPKWENRCNMTCAIDNTPVCPQGSTLMNCVCLVIPPQVTSFSCTHYDAGYINKAERDARVSETNCSACAEEVSVSGPTTDGPCYIWTDPEIPCDEEKGYHKKTENESCDFGYVFDYQKDNASCVKCVRGDCVLEIVENEYRGLASVNGMPVAWEEGQSINRTLELRTGNPNYYHCYRTSGYRNLAEQEEEWQVDDPVQAVIDSLDDEALEEYGTTYHPAIRTNFEQYLGSSFYVTLVDLSIWDNNEGVYVPYEYNTYVLKPEARYSDWVLTDGCDCVKDTCPVGYFESETLTCEFGKALENHPEVSGCGRCVDATCDQLAEQIQGTRAYAYSYNDIMADDEDLKENVDFVATNLTSKVDGTCYSFMSCEKNSSTTSDDDWVLDASQLHCGKDEILDSMPAELEVPEEYVDNMPMCYKCVENYCSQGTREEKTCGDGYVLHRSEEKDEYNCTWCEPADCPKRSYTEDDDKYAEKQADCQNDASNAWIETKYKSGEKSCYKCTECSGSFRYSSLSAKQLAGGGVCDGGYLSTIEGRYGPDDDDVYTCYMCTGERPYFGGGGSGGSGGGGGGISTGYESYNNNGRIDFGNGMMWGGGISEGTSDYTESDAFELPEIDMGSWDPCEPEPGQEDTDICGINRVDLTECGQNMCAVSEHCCTCTQNDGSEQSVCKPKTTTCATKCITDTKLVDGNDPAALQQYIEEHPVQECGRAKCQEPERCCECTQDLGGFHCAQSCPDGCYDY